MSKNLKFIEHLEELRTKLFSTAILFVLFFGVAAYFSKELFSFLQMPLLPHLDPKSYFIATTATSGWFVYLKTAFMVALIAIIPVLLIQVFTFVNPGLKANEKKAIWPFLIFLILFFFAGLAFAYFIALPFGYEFMVKIYADTDIQFLPNISEYLSFTLKIILALGLMFDLPFLILILLATGLVKRKRLSKARPFIYVGAFIISAILTPPDYVSQIMIAIPFILLFELGMLLSLIFKKK